MSEIIIKVENLSKKYTIGTKSSSSLRETLVDGWDNLIGKPKFVSKEFWALKNVSFEVKQGEVLGIIGKNGAGKSTLLKVLSRITEPTSGRAEITGRVSSLLEIGTGFHHELTGRENIFLNGTILGMSRKEVKAKFDEIVDFSGVEKFIDTPVKHFSSGMYVRLAFAVAAHLEPEILIIDEVLAVGDAEFQKKCLGKMKDVAGQGRTVLFVSHNLSTVATICNSTLLLNKGCILKQGNTKQIIKDYLNIQNEDTELYHKQGDKSILINDIKINNSKNRVSVNIFEPINVVVSFIKNNIYFKFSEFFILISDDSLNYVVSYFQKDSGRLFSVENLKEECKINFVNNLHPGIYYMSIGIFNENRLLLDLVENAIMFEVGSTFSNKDPFDHRLGSVFLQAEWKLL